MSTLREIDVTKVAQALALIVVSGVLVATTMFFSLSWARANPTYFTTVGMCFSDAASWGGADKCLSVATKIAWFRFVASIQYAP